MNINLSNSTLELNGEKKLTSGLLFFLGTILFLLTPVYLKSQHVDYLYTNFEGYWDTSMKNEKKLNDLNEILAFRIQGSGEIYSTGVDDAKLTENGVSFIPHSFRALPVVNLLFPSDANGPIDGGGGPLLFGFPAKLDGNQTVALPPPFDLPGYKVSIPLTMGQKGLDIGSLITNVPSTTSLSFELLNNISEASVSDDIPDFFITQEADVASSGELADHLWFTDENGVQLGDQVDVIMSQAPVLGTLQLDLYRLRTGVASVHSTNTERSVRLHTFKISEFNIPTADISKIKYLKYNFNGYSDPGVIAYNEETFKFLKEVCTQIPVSTVGGNPSKVGISTSRKLNTDNWMESVPNGFLVLESENKGLVLTRTTSASIPQLIEGMMIYDTADHCIKLYNGIFWNCVEKTCNEQ